MGVADGNNIVDKDIKINKTYWSRDQTYSRFKALLSLIVHVWNDVLRIYET